jgi:hypothetical protein
MIATPSICFDGSSSSSAGSTYASWNRDQPRDGPATACQSCWYSLNGEQRTDLIHVELSSLLGPRPMLIERFMLFLPGGPFPLHFALDPSVKIVEEIIVGFLRGGFALDGAGDVRLVVALD